MNHVKEASQVGSFSAFRSATSFWEKEGESGRREWPLRRGDCSEGDMGGLELKGWSE
jgi:hypothetical protein